MDVGRAGVASRCRRCGHAFFPGKSLRFVTFASDHRLWWHQSDEIELGSNLLALAQSTRRLLEQLASWGRDGSEESIGKLVAVGRKATGDEAAAAEGLALLAASQEPGAQRSAPEASVHCHPSCRGHSSFSYISCKLDVNTLRGLQRATSFQFSPCFADNTDGTFQLTGVWATSFCLLMTATRTQGCRQSVAIGSIPLVVQSGGLCFEVTVHDMVASGSEVYVKRPSAIAGAVLVSASAAGRPSAIAGVVIVPRLRRKPRWRQHLDGCRGTRAARVRAEYPKPEVKRNSGRSGEGRVS